MTGNVADTSPYTQPVRMTGWRKSRPPLFAATPQLLPAMPQRHLSIDLIDRPHPGISNRTARLTVKRAFDVLLSSLLLLALTPIFAAIAMAIKLDSRGPVFFRVRRVGRDSSPLPMLKFRKMHDGALGGPLTVDGDARLTRVGAVLTRTRLDELPQLWDVLRGRMSIIGPRPEDPAFVELHRRDYDEILVVRPGITGLSQIAYREEASIVDADCPVDDYVGRIMPQKLTMDKLYASRVSLLLDFRIIYWTFVTVVLRRPVSVNRVTAAMNLRRRPGARDLARASSAGGSRLVSSGRPITPEAPPIANDVRTSQPVPKLSEIS